MATVIPVDEFITDEWYPGFKPGYTHAPWYIDPLQTFRKADEENVWFLDFHWPRGLTPMGRIWNELGLDPGQIGKFLQGYDTKIMETDRELWKLTSAARRAGLEQVFAAHEADGIRAALAAHGGSAGAWLTQFDDFLQVYGWRTEGSCDIALPSWIEDPTPALGTIKTFLLKDTDHDFEAARNAAVEEREAAVDVARSTLTLEEQKLFDGGLASCRAANFPWWQDDHNYYIDLRIALPMRWACQGIADRIGADHQDDTLYLFWEEIMDVSAGRRPYDAGLRSLVEQRKQYFDYWLERRPSLPKVVGTIPASVNDPILIEIFGLNSHFLRAVEAVSSGGQVKTLTGVPASKGTGRGPARVLHNADDLHQLSPGDVLVCESTSPNWTPAFAKIAACVCDGGGTLSHAAIVGREYGVPTVTAVGLATMVISDGDEVKVDGTTGRVTVLKQVPNGQG